MSSLHHQHYTLRLGQTAPERISVLSFHVAESLGNPYEITVHFTSPKTDLPPLDLLELLDQRASFSIHPTNDDHLPASGMAC